MERSLPSQSITNTYAQSPLFLQVIRAGRLVSLGILLVTLLPLLWASGLALPQLLLPLLAVLQVGITEMAIRWTGRSAHPQRVTLFYCIMTLVLLSGGALIINLAEAAALGTAALTVVVALLLGPRYTAVLSSLGLLLYVVLEVLVDQDWSDLLQIHPGPTIENAIHIAFLALLLLAVALVSAVGGSQLQRNARDVHSRAIEAERAQAEQAELNAQLNRQISEQKRLLEVIQDLEVPAIPVLPGVLVLPLISYLDSQRIERIEQQLLQRVFSEGTRLVLVDVTAVPLIDTAVAAKLLQLARAVRLLGAEMGLTGLSGTVAQTLVSLDVGLDEMRTYGTIQDALADPRVYAGAVRR